MVATPASAPTTARPVSTSHEGFLRHARFRWLKIAVVSCFVALAGYIAADVQPRANGGSWYGYLLGTTGALLIVWLALLGIRKRAMTPGRWSLKAWTSAHVYLGFALILIATLHTGFQFGWNVHSLAYGLMMLVILSGIFGTVVYATLPAALSQNREEMTQGQMNDSIRAIDRQLHEAAQPLVRSDADLVIAALGQSEFERGLWRRLSGNYPDCATLKAIEGLGLTDAAGSGDAAAGRVETLLIRRRAQLERLRRHLRLKALLEVWLHVHVPATVALLAALAAHIISVFYYW